MINLMFYHACIQLLLDSNVIKKIIDADYIQNKFIEVYNENSKSVRLHITKLRSGDFVLLYEDNYYLETILIYELGPGHTIHIIDFNIRSELIHIDLNNIFIQKILNESYAGFCKNFSIIQKEWQEKKRTHEFWINLWNNMLNGTYKKKFIQALGINADFKYIADIIYEYL